MKKFLLIAAVLASSVALASQAEARRGCSGGACARSKTVSVERSSGHKTVTVEKAVSEKKPFDPFKHPRDPKTGKFVDAEDGAVAASTHKSGPVRGFARRVGRRAVGVLSFPFKAIRRLFHRGC